MEREFARLGMSGDARIGFYTATKETRPGLFHRPGAHGCFRSHLAVLSEAWAARSSVLVLEDDCRFRPEARWLAPSPETDILYGGYAQASDADDLLSADIQGSHCMGFSVAALEKLVPFLNSLLQRSTKFDSRIVRSDFDPAIRPPIDGAYVWFRRYHPELVTEFLPLADYRDSASDVADLKWFDRTPGVRVLANSARRLRERLTSV
ncbi:hypothetical protein EYB45_10115 [Erythrobacteraceae bacterium CFH 75059]|uniref:hypothetical protein n=1 Tax=Qipengyuania thermophila TaxID=2509361 RepID=UPI00102158C9|nr:hypothetical protein [Qipengyuania thermophila]TCD02031.1 hypothetical protein EYB45_10115 [Erythrobacteraceae bacterium CFH 75059]